MSKSRLSMIATVAIASTCLIGAGTAGAVAGQLVTSDDIQDRTIVHRDIAKDGIKRGLMAPNSVTWNKVLSKGAKQKVAALGADGGKLAGYNQYMLDGEPGPSEVGALPMTGMLPEIELEPGTYQVSVHGIADTPGLIVAGALDEYNALFHGCWATTGVSFEIPLASCDSTYVIEVDEPTTMPVSFYPLEGEPGPGFFIGGAYAEVSVIEVGGSLPKEPHVPLSPKQKKSLNDLLKR